MHIDEFVNDSTNLYWAGRTFTGEEGGHWSGDQLYLGISNRIGVEGWSNWEGNPWSAPDGPYHLMIMGDQVTFNDSVAVWTPEEFRPTPEDTFVVYNPADFIRSAVKWDTTKGVWDVELAIYNPNVGAQSSIAFNIAGSTGSRQAKAAVGDAYGYYIWQPSVANDPWASALSENWNTYYIQQDSRYWALLEMMPVTTGIKIDHTSEQQPVQFSLSQNYPNPFNPSTTIRFDLAEKSPVTLKVYNTVGQVVAVLLDEKPFAAGSYSVAWNARELASGVYFYELQAANTKLTKKMMLIK